MTRLGWKGEKRVVKASEALVKVYSGRDGAWMFQTNTNPAVSFGAEGFLV